MSDSRLARMFGDAIAAPVRVASLLRDSAAALDEVTGDAARDAAALALAATERTALSSAEAISAVAGHLGSSADREGTATVAVSIPDAPPSKERDAAAADPGDRTGRSGAAAHVHVRDGGRTATFSAPQSVPQRHREVDYDFFSGIAPEIRHPGGALPGANRWDAAPDPQHPVPVVLVHGTGGGGQTNWGPYVPLLTGHGFSVFTLTYGALPDSRWPVSAIGGMRRIEDSAAEFGDFAHRVLDATGAERIDVVGHSQGTLVPAYWTKFLGGGTLIRRYVSLGPLWRGTRAFGALRGTLGALGLRFGGGADVTASLSIPQMITGSDFLEQLWSGDAPGTEGPYVKGIEYTNISTRHDEFVVPYTSGQVPGGEGMDVTNIVVQDGCPDDHSDHLGICGSRRAAAIVLNALDDVDQMPVPCGFVPPFFG